MTILSPHLAFDSSPLPHPGAHVVVSDTVGASGSFALYHLAIAAILQRVPVIWLDFRAEGLSSWTAIMRKLGTPLPAPPAFVHIAPSPLPSSIPLDDDAPRLFVDGSPTLEPTYTALSSALASLESTCAIKAPAAGRLPTPFPSSHTPPSALILLDGLSELVLAGFPAADVARFVRAVLALARKSSAVTVSAAHADHLPLTPDDHAAGSDAASASPHAPAPTSAPAESTPEADLLTRLFQLGGTWWRVEGLASGRSADVSGEISVHPLDGAGEAVGRRNPLQYRLENAGVSVFAKGTGRGYL